MYRGFISRAEWGARPPKSHPGQQYQDQGMILHWEGPKMWGDLWVWAHDSCYEKVRGIQNYHMDRAGYHDIAYNYVTCPHGFIFEGRGAEMMNAASGNYNVNQHTFAMCFLWGDGDDDLVLNNNPDPVDAMNSLRNYALAPEGQLGWGVRPHKYIFNTACPGPALTFIANAHDGQPRQPVGNEGPPKTPAGDYIIFEGSAMWMVICDWQGFLKIPVTGVFDGFMKQKVAEWQAFFGINEEYPTGNPIVASKCYELRRFLEALPPAPPAEPTTPAGDPILYPGSPNWMAICDWQKFINIPVTGIFDVTMTNALRDWQGFFGIKEEYPEGNPIVAEKCWGLRRYIESLPPAPVPQPEPEPEPQPEPEPIPEPEPQPEPLPIPRFNQEDIALIVDALREVASPTKNTVRRFKEQLRGIVT